MKCVYVDQELGGEGFTYELASGRTGTEVVLQALREEQVAHQARGGSRKREAAPSSSSRPASFCATATMLRIENVRSAS